MDLHLFHFCRHWLQLGQWRDVQFVLTLLSNFIVTFHMGSMDSQRGWNLTNINSWNVKYCWKNCYPESYLFKIFYSLLHLQVGNVQFSCTIQTRKSLHNEAIFNKLNYVEIEELRMQFLFIYEKAICCFLSLHVELWLWDISRLPIPYIVRTLLHVKCSLFGLEISDQCFTQYFNWAYRSLFVYILIFTINTVRIWSCHQRYIKQLNIMLLRLSRFTSPFCYS